MPAKRSEPSAIGSSNVVSMRPAFLARGKKRPLSKAAGAAVAAAAELEKVRGADRRLAYRMALEAGAKSAYAVFSRASLGVGLPWERLSHEQQQGWRDVFRTFELGRTCGVCLGEMICPACSGVSVQQVVGLVDEGLAVAELVRR